LPAIYRTQIFATLLAVMATFLMPLLVAAADGPSSSVVNWGGTPVVLGAPGRQVSGRAYMGTTLSDHPRLIIVLHGDAPFGNPVYHYAFAHSLSQNLKDVVILAILRPGYSDGLGGRSDGNRGLATGDNYTKDATKQLNQAVSEAAAKWHTRETSLIGHSGGAALAILMLADRPGLASSALVVSCPCDLKAWRLHMAARQFNPVFLLPVHSLSPSDEISRLLPQTRLTFVVGDQDAVAPPWMTQNMAKLASARGLQVQVKRLPDRGHDIFNTPEVLNLAKALP
jgi:alpha-beta hydrolase superfamily lysophospholipase